MKAASSRIILPSAAPLLLLLLLLIAALPVAAAELTLEQGYDAFERGDTAQALDIWYTLAEQGNATAQVNLGQLYRLGKGVRQSNAVAAQWYVRAANNGSDIARYTLLKMYEEGRVSKEEVEKVFATAELSTSPAISPTTQAAAQATAKPTTWLSGLEPDQYLVQIIGSSSEQGLRDYAAKNLTGVQPTPQVVKTQNKGKDWYILLMGPFDDSKHAQMALRQLPQKVRANKPWPRSVASVRDSVKPAPSP